MQQIEIDLIKGQILERIRKGDYIILGELLNVPQDTARTRFRRNKENAVLTMKNIVENREEFIKKHKQI